ncbi:MAG: serine/threonine-protein kinase, partial [Holophagales bacterium]|nr:serine/threonine-protein kinase [Holophagales bacterium]
FPYFAMELVDGPSITAYCDREQLDIAQRLELFATVCRAVQHAHEKGLIHRDLKPSNILVANIDGKAVPKVIDFGIAKAIDQPIDESTLATGGGLVGTPGYLAPEVARSAGGAADIDTRSDVYSLGVVLHELLVGIRPLDLEGMPLLEALDKISKAEPRRLSECWSRLDEPIRDRIAAARGVEAIPLGRRIRDDLEWITLEALASDRKDRYESAHALAADVERHLRHEPVLARPPSTLYRLRKYARRNRAAVIGATTAGLALLAGVIGIGVGYLRASNARDAALKAEALARAEAETTRRVSAFLEDIFENSDPESRPGAELTGRELLDQAAERIDFELNEDPRVRASLLLAIGRAFNNLGIDERAEPLLDEALALRRADPSSAPADTAAILLQLGLIRWGDGDLQEAQALFEQALLLARQGGETQVVVDALNQLGNLRNRNGRYEESEPAFREALELAERTWGPESKEVATALHGLSASFGYRGHYGEARAWIERGLAIRRRQVTPDHPTLGTSLTSLGLVLAGQGELKLAVERLKEAVDIYRRSLGADSVRTLTALNNLGYTLFRAQRYAEAASFLEEATAELDPPALEKRPFSASLLTNLGLSYWKLGRLEKAEPLFVRAVDIRRQSLPPGHPHHAT